MSFILDILLLVIIALFIIFSIRRGLIRSVMNLFAFAAALLCGWYFAPAISGFYYDKFLFSSISKGFSDAISALIGTGENMIDISRLFEDKPQAFLDIASRYGLDPEAIESIYYKSLSEGVEDALKHTADTIAHPIASGIANILGFLTAFALVFIAALLLMLVLDLIFQLPILDSLNRALGGVFGGLCGYATATLLAMLIFNLAPYLCKTLPQLFSENTINNTIVLNALMNVNPFEWLADKIL